MSGRAHDDILPLRIWRGLSRDARESITAWSAAIAFFGGGWLLLRLMGSWTPPHWLIQLLMALNFAGLAICSVRLVRERRRRRSAQEPAP